jgi:hypothetical protein
VIDCQIAWIYRDYNLYNRTVGTTRIKTRSPCISSVHYRRHRPTELVDTIQVAAGTDGTHPDTGFSILFSWTERTPGGLFALDGVHPTTIAYGLVAQELINVMQVAGVQF